eukprot:3982587-Prymnesium_polylepis.1
MGSAPLARTGRAGRPGAWWTRRARWRSETGERSGAHIYALARAVVAVLPVKQNKTVRPLRAPR